MQTSSKTSPRPSQPKQILLIGLPGSGKTTLAMQFPNVYFLDADLNLDGPEKRLRKQYPNLEFKYDTIIFDENGKEIEEHLRVTRLLNLCDAARKDPWVKTIVFDGLTNITQYLVWEIQKAQKRDVLEIRDWGLHKGKMLSLLIKQRMTGKTVIMTCHQEDKTKKVGNSLEVTIEGYLPSINPSLQKDLAGMFTDVWHTELRARPGSVYENWLQTMPNGMMPFLKNSIGMSADIDVTTNAWATLSKYWPS